MIKAKQPCRRHVHITRNVIQKSKIYTIPVWRVPHVMICPPSAFSKILLPHLTKIDCHTQAGKRWYTLCLVCLMIVVVLFVKRHYSIVLCVWRFDNYQEAGRSLDFVICIYVILMGDMVETKVFTKEEYVTLIPPVSTSDYEGIKQSIKEHNGLLMPIVINQNHVVLDGHHRLRACKELGIPVS